MTIFLLSLAASTFADSWTTEIVVEGGYDVTETAIEPLQDGDATQGGTLSSAPIDLGGYITSYDIAYHDGKIYIAYALAHQAIQLAIKENGVWSYQNITTNPEGYLWPQDMFLDVDSQGHVHLIIDRVDAYQSPFFSVYITNSNYYGNFTAYRFAETVEDYELKDLSVSQNDQIYVSTTDNCFYLFDDPEHDSGLYMAERFGNIDLIDSSALGASLNCFSSSSSSYRGSFLLEGLAPIFHYIESVYDHYYVNGSWQSFSRSCSGNSEYFGVSTLGVYISGYAYGDRIILCGFSQTIPHIYFNSRMYDASYQNNDLIVTDTGGLLIFYFHYDPANAYNPDEYGRNRSVDGELSYFSYDLFSGTFNYNQNVTLDNVLLNLADWSYDNPSTTSDIRIAKGEGNTYHVVYYDDYGSYDEDTYTSGYLKYMEFEWDSDLDVSLDLHTDDLGSYNDLVLDGFSPLISYYNADDEALQLASIQNGQWIEEVVDTDGSVGKHNSITLDAQGNVHLAYYSEIYSNGYTSKNLMYATNKFGSWFVDTVDAPGDLGEYTDILVDANGMVHISYYDSTNGGLKEARAYVRSSSIPWTIQTVDTGSGNDVGQYSSIEVDSQGNIHIAYYDASTKNIRLAYESNGSWVIKGVARSNQWDLGQYLSLAIDSQDDVYISYYNASLQDLELISGDPDATVQYSGQEDNASLPMGGGLLSSNTSSTFSSSIKANSMSSLSVELPTGWVREILDTDGDVGKYTDITLDDDGYVHIAYLDLDELVLKYINNFGGTWNQRSADVEDYTGFYNSIAIDANRTLHFVTYERDQRDLRYISL